MEQPRQLYAPQYGGQIPQPYQVTPSGSQYVSVAPSGMAIAPAQPGVIGGFGRGPGGFYRGQRPPNPCICFKDCCGGTCSLRTGCYVIAFLSLIGGTGISGGSSSKMNPAMSNSHSDGLVYSDAFFFNFLSGVFLIIGAGCLEPTCCTVAGVLYTCGGVFILFEGIYLADYILNDPLFRFTYGSSKDEWAYGLIIAGIIGLLTRSYYGYCACSLGKQIRNGEYSVEMPQPMIAVQQAFTTAPIAASNAKPNPSQMAVQIADNQEK